MNLMAIDVATLQPGLELDALIAEKWMGWEPCCPVETVLGWHDPVSGEYRSGTQGNSSIWSPSTNPAHAGEARRKEGDWELFSNPKDGNIMCRFHGRHEGFCSLSETNGDKGKAEALATCRAIVAVLKAAEAAGGEG